MSDEFRYDYDEHMQRKRERARATRPLCPSLVHGEYPLCICSTITTLPKGTTYRLHEPGEGFLSAPHGLEEDLEVRLVMFVDDMTVFQDRARRHLYVEKADLTER